jgi:hypothetical protein
MPKFRVTAHLDTPTFYTLDIEAADAEAAMAEAREREAADGVLAFEHDEEGEPWRIIWDGVEELGAADAQVSG